MKFKIKDMDITTGGPLVAIINQHDATRLNLHHGDRIRIKRGKKETVAILDIAESEKAVPEGRVGIFEELLDRLHGKHNDVVDIRIAKRPDSIRYIKKKLRGKDLSAKEIKTIIKDVVDNKLTNIELSYFVAGGFTRGFSIPEVVALTKAMIETGGRIKLKGKVFDKHCTGGVAGNRTTMLVVPIVAAAGLKIPKTSSRAITSAAGTADTMEVLTNVNVGIGKMRKIVSKLNGCIVWGGAINLAPADDKIIKVEHSVGIDPFLLQSILAKKGSVSATHILVDIPLGRETKIKTRNDALSLVRRFKDVGKSLGMKIKVIITDGNRPIGNGIGPALEAKDILYVLRRDYRRPLDLEKKAVRMSGMILEMAGFKNGHKKAMEILESGKAYEKMKQIIKAQGGKAGILPEQIPLGRFTYHYRSKINGRVTDWENGYTSRIARLAGAPLDKMAGIFIHKHEGQKVKKGKKIFTIYAQSKEKLKHAVEMLKIIPIVRVR